MMPARLYMLSVLYIYSHIYMSYVCVCAHVCVPVHHLSLFYLLPFLNPALLPNILKIFTERGLSMNQ